MGNQVSSIDAKEREITGEKVEKGEKTKPPAMINANRTEVTNEIFNASSYKGVRTDTVTKEDKSVSNDETTVTAVTVTQDMKVATLFEWKDGGGLVYVAGSFSNWTQWFVMAKNPTSGNFEVTLELPRGVHQYKFIVDNKWAFSKHHPTCQDDKGNINNIIDTTSRLYVAPKDSLKVQLERNPHEVYSDYFPKKDEMNLDAPNVPPHYSDTFNIDNSSLQMSIGNSKFLQFSIRNQINENNSFKEITDIPHANLNHLFTKCSYNQDAKVLTTLSTHRIRNKILTVTYYKPL